MMTATQTTTASAAATQRVRECKAQLFRVLQRRHRDAWRTYWTTFRQYLVAKVSIQHFHATAESLLGKEHIMLHNAFVVALLQDCSDHDDLVDDDTEVDTGGSSTGDSEKSTGDKGVKIEPPTQCQHDDLDTESAELLMGLGRSGRH